VRRIVLPDWRESSPRLGLSLQQGEPAWFALAR